MCLYLTDVEMSDSNGETYVPQSSSSRDTKRRKRRWSDDEKHLLLDTFGSSITAKTMPTGKAICAFASKLPTRTIAQIRTQLHNIITGKVTL